MAEMYQGKKDEEITDYRRTKMQEESILQRLKNRGFRITKQRRMLLDIILEEEYASYKEIYYKAKKEDDKIGAATVYRMINLLEEIGAISRNRLYQISCSGEKEQENICMIELDDHTICHFSAKELNQVISEGLKACGYVERQKVICLRFEPASFSPPTYGSRK